MKPPSSRSRRWSAWALAAPLLLAVVCSGPHAAAAGRSRAEAQYAVCSSCHGPKGEGLAARSSPKLAGLESDYLARQLENYRRGYRGGVPDGSRAALMRPMAFMVTDPALQAELVALIASLPGEPSAPTVASAGDPVRGQTLFPVCSGCHGIDGAGNPMLSAPRLAGQHAGYLVEQLQAFRSGKRGANPEDGMGVQMAAMARTLADDQAVLDVAAYLATLRPGDNAIPTLPAPQ